MNKEKEQILNTIRILSCEGIQKAKSGHPGLPMGSATLAYTLWEDKMKHSPKNPNWLNRDRFILSAGHGSMLLYSLLYLFEYGLTIEDLKGFRQWDTKTPGHPEHGHTIGVESTTGPLGQGLANGVGMAMAESNLAKRFNTDKHSIIDHYTYVLSGDGCMMEGISYEAASLAGTLALDKLIVMYDSNGISIEGSTEIAFQEDVGKRFEALGWQVINVENGNDEAAIKLAIENAKNEKNKPSLIVAKTIIGYGCESKQGTADVHGAPIGDDNISLMKQKYGFEETPFFVPKEVNEYMSEVINKKNEDYTSWSELYDEYKKANPELATELENFLNDNFDYDFLIKEVLDSVGEKPVATRSASGSTIQKIIEKIPHLFGGSADLEPSNKTYMKNKGDYSKNNRTGMNVHFGVREHAMAAIANGISLHGGLKPYVGTFFVFSDYMRGAIRLSAIMKLPVTYVLTHDSIGVGEDGPTHQPIEHLSSLRSIPNLNVFRPADEKETIVGWYSAMIDKNPTALILSRQNLPQLNTGIGARKGAYTIVEPSQEPQGILIATGSEVAIACEAAKELENKGVYFRVVSMPSWELFEQQSDEYKESVLPKNIKNKVSIEAGATIGWHKYVGSEGSVIGIDSFGASGPFATVYKEYGISVDNIIDKVMKLTKN
jgi:transketolase